MGLIFATARLHLPIRLGAQRVELAWGEAGLVLALAVVPAAWVVLLTPIAVGLSFAQRRFPPIKTLYNLSSNTIAATAAAAVLAISGTFRPFRGLDLILLASAGAIAGIVTYVAVAAVIATVQDVPLGATWRASGGLQVLTLAGNLGLAVSVLALGQYSPWAVAVLPVIGVCLHQGYVGRLRGHQEREAGQLRTAAVGRLTADLDEPGVLRRLAEGACQLVTADVVEVELPDSGPSCSPVLYRYGRSGEAWAGSPSNAPSLPAQLIATLPIPIADGGRSGQLRVWLASTAADMQLGQGEHAALQSLVMHTGAAVTNARLHAQQTYYANHDRLTGLPARPLLIDRIQAVVRSGLIADNSGPVALLVIGLTGYGDLLRTLGHDFAEDLLVRTARRLEAAAAEDEFVSHVDGSNFAVYLRDATSPAHVRSRALWLISAITRAIRLDATDLPTTQVTLRAVAGAAFSPTPVIKGAELLRQAFVAIEVGRDLNLDFGFYDPADDDLGGPASIVLRSELNAALDENQLDLHYQPIVHVPSGAPVGLEALLRWNHPTRGQLHASQFLPILERSSDYPRFVAWQLERALGTLAMVGDKGLPISINLAARCLLDDRFPRQVAAALERAGVAPDQLMLEIDESDPLLTQAGLVNEALTELRLLGIKIAIDRLGAGASSLSGLLKVPATHVKIDGYLVSQMLVDPEAAALVGLGLDFGSRAETQFIATGVNSDEHVDVLRRLGCDIAQGPRLVRPLLADELDRYLATAPELPAVDDNVVPLDSHRHTPVPN